MKKRIAFLSSSNYQDIIDQCPDFINEFELLHPLFANLDAELIKVNWRDPSIQWDSFHALTPKACWDYAAHSAEFESFLKNIMTLNVPMKNAASTILWNMRKTYLLDLKNRGLPVGELLIISQHSKKSLQEIINDLNQSVFNASDMLVAKPSIGGGAIDTVRFAKNEIEKQDQLFKKILSYSDLILQPFFPEIAQDGEYSYFFFNNEFSHAILKKPVKGDYRAHQLYGAKNISYTPTPSEIREAFSFLSVIQPPCEYARVDVFKRKGVLYLIELELIEPYLYFERASQESIIHFCQALIKN